jgi:hypothetical protein
MAMAPQDATSGLMNMMARRPIEFICPCFAKINSYHPLQLTQMQSSLLAPAATSDKMALC